MPWDSLRDVQTGEYGRNPALFMWLDDPDACIVTPSGKRSAFTRSVKQSRDWVGCDLMLMTTHYGFDLPVLAAAIERYRSVGPARRELAVQRIDT